MKDIDLYDSFRKKNFTAREYLSVYNEVEPIFQSIKEKRREERLQKKEDEKLNILEIVDLKPEKRSYFEEEENAAYLELNNIIAWNVLLSESMKNLKEYSKKFRYVWSIYNNNIKSFLDLTKKVSRSDENFFNIIKRLFNDYPEFAYKFLDNPYGILDYRNRLYYPKLIDEAMSIVIENKRLCVKLIITSNLAKTEYRKLINNIESDTELDLKENSYKYIYNYLEKIYEKYGKEIFRTCDISHKKMFLMFHIFQDYFDDNLKNIFLDHLKKFKKRQVVNYVILTLHEKDTTYLKKLKGILHTMRNGYLNSNL